ncbi:NAD(P)H-dependent oxidoreductase [Candidatus Saccharibacteria bacterium]|nr:NAD(P)H-dependent oxidoreductase [Candidatus Saccharibacteria bacterium]
MKIKVILGSTRPGRTSERVAKWVLSNAAEHAGFEAEIIDLADYPMPYFEEVAPPQYNPKRELHDVVAKFLAKLDEADGLIIVSPEYNRSSTAVLVNAIDHIDFQLKHKPVAIVTHGSTGGASAADALRQQLRGFNVANVAEAVTLFGAGTIIDEDGVMSDEAKAQPYGPQTVIGGLLDSLDWWATTLKAGRNQS